jgi:allophanate hydrolase subunit 2
MARGGVSVLRVVGGPRLDWFEAGALDRLCAGIYTLTAASNRTGLRLDGEPMRRSTDAELPSEGLVTGALQVPPDGLPILLLADHPTVGGYPVIAVVVSADIGRAAQLRPGDRLRFTGVPPSATATSSRRRR